MKKAVVMVLVLAAVLVFGASQAMCLAGMPIYAGVKGGVFMPNGDEEEGLGNLDMGFNVEGFIGMDVMEPLAVEVGVGYYRSTGSETIEGVTADETASVIPVTLTAKGNFKVMEALTVYGGGGLGIYRATAKVTADAVDLDISESATKVGFHLVGGAEYRLSEALALLAEIKWFSVKPSFGGQIDDDIKFGGIIINAGVRF